MIWTLANRLTLARVLAIPLFVAVFHLPTHWAAPAAAWIFAAASLTDWLDGYLARRLGQTSALGAFLDPVADKLMVSAALVLVVAADPRPLIVLPAILIIGREIAVSALREWMAEMGARPLVAVSGMGKIKTVFQMVAIFLLLLRGPVFGLSTYVAGVALLYLAALLTLWSLVLYVRAAWPTLRAG